MITGIGVDILHLSRLRHLLHRRGADALARRILCAAELAEFHALPPTDGREAAQTRYLASRYALTHPSPVPALTKRRWAAKEALYKAAFPTYRLTWKQIQLTKDAGKPVLRVTNPPPSTADLEDPRTRNAPRMDEVHERIHVSLSDDADVVVAYVVVERVP